MGRTRVGCRDGYRDGYADRKVCGCTDKECDCTEADDVYESTEACEPKDETDEATDDMDDMDVA